MEVLNVEIVTCSKLYPTSSLRRSPQRLIKLIGSFIKCHGVCGNNGEFLVSQIY